MFKLFLIIGTIFFVQACGSPASNTIVSKAENKISPTPVPTSITPKDGDYNGKGLVTQVNIEAGWVEIDHEDIKDLMPPMKMMFNVSDKAILKGINAGDKVDFVIRYKNHNEIVTAIKKAR